MKGYIQFGKTRVWVGGMVTTHTSVQEIPYATNRHCWVWSVGGIRGVCSHCFMVMEEKGDHPQICSGKSQK